MQDIENVGSDHDFGGFPMREAIGYDGQSLQRLNASNLAVRVEYDVSNNPIYIGLASPGSLDSQERWQLRKLTFDVANNCTSIEFASGSPSFNKIWNSRKDGTYTYS